MIDPEKLKAFLDTLVKDPSLKMRPDGTTFCNIGVQRTCVLFNCHDFEKIVNENIEPLMAREIIAFLATNPGTWLKVEGPQAVDYAKRGGLGIASMSIFKVDENKKKTDVPAAHDHVAILYPGELKTSPSLGHAVPQVANIGKDNGIMPSSKAFPISHGEADYHIQVG